MHMTLMRIVTLRPSFMYDWLEFNFLFSYILWVFIFICFSCSIESDRSATEWEHFSQSPQFVKFTKHRNLDLQVSCHLYKIWLSHIKYLVFETKTQYFKKKTQCFYQKPQILIDKPSISNQKLLNTKFFSILRYCRENTQYLGKGPKS